MKRAAAAIVALFACLIVTIEGQQQPPPQPTPRFQAGVDLVVVDVSVLDADRRPVRGLTADDFTVVEDGRPQAIKTFSSIDLPDAVDEAPVAWMREVQPDVSRNDTLSNRRIVVLVLDDSMPMPADEVPRLKMMARKVVERLGPNDLAAVVYTFGQRYGQDFTTDRARLLAAVDRFNGAVDKTVVPGAFNSDPLQQTARLIAFDEYDPAALTLYSSVVNTLRTVSEYLTALRDRRKALIFASVGLPLDVEATKPTLISLAPGESLNQDKPGGANALFEALGKTFLAAQRANVNIYSLDPGGLRAPAGQYDALAGTGGLSTTGKLNQDFLHAVANNTGGFTIADTNRVDEGVAQIFRENGSYYLLGYEPPGPRVPGRFRRIEVKVNRPGATVRARNGYYEADGSTPAVGKAAVPGLEKALSSIMPTPDLALQATAAPFALAERRDAGVVIAVAVRQAAPQSAERVPDDVKAQVNAYDAEGRLRASDRLSARIMLRPGLSGEVVFELLSRVDLEPGRYQLRIAAESSLEHKSGSVYADLEVPDFRRRALSLSGVVLNATPNVAAVRKEATASLIPLVPTALRGFDPDQRVTAFVRIYQGGTGAAVPVTLAVRILDDRGAAVHEETATISPDRFSVARAADYRIDVPTAEMQPGPHLLTIEAKAGGETVRRDVRFRVR